MKVISLMPIKNEAWMLPYVLENLSQFSDEIVVADQMSTDGSREILKAHPKVTLIDNRRQGHSNQVRWDLLDAAREFEGKNLLLSVDADEMLPPRLFIDFLGRMDSLGVKGGTALEFLWVQLWKSPRRYRNDGSVWSGIWKQVAFLDDGEMDFDREKVVLNDHTSRVPAVRGNRVFRVEGVPLLHFQWVYWERTQLKQAWYRCSELVKGRSALRVNHKYGITLDEPGAKLDEVPPEWLEGVRFPEKAPPTAWQLEEILAWFDEYKPEFFEPLEIWHIPELKTEFVKRVGREPHSYWASPLLREAGKLKWRVLRAAGR
jgi:glycosyltransferase involved in cell wall biosynthesis